MTLQGKMPDDLCLVGWLVNKSVFPNTRCLYHLASGILFWVETNTIEPPRTPSQGGGCYNRRTFNVINADMISVFLFLLNL